MGGYGAYGYGGYGYPDAYGYYDDEDDGGCYLVRRRVMTRYGWRIRRVQVSVSSALDKRRVPAGSRRRTTSVSAGRLESSVRRSWTA